MCEDEYSAADIRVISPCEHVRLRPQMYVGDVTKPESLHYLAHEIINNSIDEVTAGFAKNISVIINHDGSITIEDDGRGMPVARLDHDSERAGREGSALEIVMTEFRCGAAQ